MQCHAADDGQVHTPDLGLPGLDESVPESWTTLEDDFVLIYAVHQVGNNELHQYIR